MEKKAKEVDEYQPLLISKLRANRYTTPPFNNIKICGGEGSRTLV